MRQKQSASALIVLSSGQILHGNAKTRPMMLFQLFIYITETEGEQSDRPAVAQRRKTDKQQNAVISSRLFLGVSAQ